MKAYGEVECVPPPVLKLDTGLGQLNTSAAIVLGVRAVRRRGKFLTIVGNRTRFFGRLSSNLITIPTELSHLTAQLKNSFTPIVRCSNSVPLLTYAFYSSSVYDFVFSKTETFAGYDYTRFCKV